LKFGPKEGASLDDRLKELMQELGNAINESLSDSERIAGAIGEIRRAGFDVFLVLEATIGFNKRSDGDDDGDAVLESGEERIQFHSPDGFSWTSQDEKFLKALKIAVDKDEE
jgi:hypothetical protein